jgi:hypothetical protein
MTLGFDAGRLYVDVTAEVPVTVYQAGEGPDPARVAGVDLGIIHPYAVAGPGGQGLLVSGRAIRAEHRQHLRDRKGRSRAAAARAPKPGQRRSRRWRQHRRRERKAEARHARRVAQAQHEAAKDIITWAVQRKIGTLAVGDPRGILDLKAGRRHNQRTRDWRVGRLIRVLADKAEAVPASPHGAGITHRRAGAHLPGVHPARRDPRRRPPSRPAPRGHLAGTGPPPAPPPSPGCGTRGVARGHREEHASRDTPSRTCELVH